MRTGDSCVGEGLARAEQPLRHGRVGDEERPGDLLAGEAADRAQGERDLRVPAERGVAAGEHQAQQLVVGPQVGSAGVSRVGLAARGRDRQAVRAGGRVGDREQSQLALADLVAAEPVECLAAGRRGQPAARVGRHPVARPVHHRLDERVLHRVLGQADVPGTRGERGPDLGRLLPVRPLERLRCRVHAAHCPSRKQSSSAAGTCHPASQRAAPPSWTEERGGFGLATRERRRTPAARRRAGTIRL